eukprot:1369396-Alexandrium_andersonii.AAC.1
MSGRPKGSKHTSQRPSGCLKLLEHDKSGMARLSAVFGSLRWFSGSPEDFFNDVCRFKAVSSSIGQC